MTKPDRWRGCADRRVIITADPWLYRGDRISWARRIFVVRRQVALGQYEIRPLRWYDLAWDLVEAMAA